MILVDVVVPCINSSFDFMLDENQSVSQITMEICDIISKYIKSENIGKKELYRLYHKETKKQLVQNYTLYQSGVRDGASLILI